MQVAGFCTGRTESVSADTERGPHRGSWIPLNPKPKSGSLAMEETPGKVKKEETPGKVKKSKEGKSKRKSSSAKNNEGKPRLSAFFILRSVT